MKITNMGTRKFLSPARKVGRVEIMYTIVQRMLFLERERERKIILHIVGVWCCSIIKQWDKSFLRGRIVAGRKRMLGPIPIYLAAWTRWNTSRSPRYTYEIGGVLRTYVRRERERKKKRKKRKTRLRPHTIGTRDATVTDTYADY